MGLGKRFYIAIIIQSPLSISILSPVFHCGQQLSFLFRNLSSSSRIILQTNIPLQPLIPNCHLTPSHSSLSSMYPQTHLSTQERNLFFIRGKSIGYKKYNFSQSQIVFTNLSITRASIHEFLSLFVSQVNTYQRRILVIR